MKKLKATRLQTARFALIGFALATMPANASNTAKNTASRDTAKSASSLPTAVLLMNEATREVFLLPPESVTSTPQASAYYSFRPAAVVRTVSSAEKANATDTPLAERVTYFASVVQKRLGTLRLDSNWGEFVVNFVAASGNLAAALNKTESAWPPPQGLAASTLAQKNGQLFVFTVREAGAGSTLEKIDLMKFYENGRIDRTYWSRSLNDPTRAESALSALEKATSQFQKITKLQPMPYDSTKMRIVFSKLTSERDVLTTESAIKSTLAEANDALLIPHEVSPSEVQYQTPLDIAKFSNFATRLKELNPKLMAVKQGETNLVSVQVAPASAPSKEQNKNEQ